MNVLKATLHEHRFWLGVAGLEILILLVGLASPLLAIALTGLLGVALLLSLAVGTRSGTTGIAMVLIVLALVLPGDLSEQYRVPVGPGGIYIVDMLLFLLMFSWILQILSGHGATLTHSTVTLPLTLFLVWVVAAGLIGMMAGHDLKYILQDARGLAYYSLFLWALSSLRSRDELLSWLRLLAGCAVAGFIVGVYYSTLGRGMQLTFVEGGTSRFPAPNEIFVVSTAMVTTFLVVWPSGRRRPLYLWGLLGLSMVGVMLALVRGYWIGLAVGFVYLFLVLRVRERLRLVGEGIAVLVLLGAVTAVVQPTVFDSVITRASAVAAYGTDASVQYRFIENRAVTAQIRDHPLQGNGLGTAFLFDWSRYGVKPVYKVYIHNNYYWFAQRLGFIGLGLFAWMMVAFLFAEAKVRPFTQGGDPWLVGLVLGSRVMIVGMLVISISSPQFNVKGEIAVIGLLMAMAEVAGSLLRGDGEPDLLEE